LTRGPSGKERRTVSAIAATGVDEAPALELVADEPGRADWREHLAVRLAYGLACATVAVLIPGEWERFCGPAAGTGPLAVPERELGPPTEPAPVPVAA
jgi:hypothetical protein